MCAYVYVFVHERVFEEKRTEVDHLSKKKVSHKPIERSMFGWLSSRKINEPHSSFARNARINRNINQSMLIKGY